jgi:hypothetical protein
MIELKKYTDSEKLDHIHKQMRRMEVSTHIQTGIAIIGFLAVIGLINIANKLKGKKLL